MSEDRVNVSFQGCGECVSATYDPEEIPDTGIGQAGDGFHVPPAKQVASITLTKRSTSTCDCDPMIQFVNADADLWKEAE